MGTTGLIYVAIVAAWAAYLVPMLLKRNDEVSRRRSAENVSSSAARVLSRQDGVQSRTRYAVRPPSSGSGPSGSSAETVTADPSPPLRFAPNRARRVAAMRRRRVLSILTLSLLSVTALAGLGMLLWWTVALPGSLIVAFIVVTRIQLRRHARTRARLAAKRRAQAEARHDRGPATAPVSPDQEMTIEVKLPVAPEPGQGRHRQQRKGQDRQHPPAAHGGHPAGSVGEMVSRRRPVRR